MALAERRDKRTVIWLDPENSDHLRMSPFATYAPEGQLNARLLMWLEEHVGPAHPPRNFEIKRGVYTSVTLDGFHNDLKGDGWEFRITLDHEHNEEYVLYFDDPKLAVLFKLTWGGVSY